MFSVRVGVVARGWLCWLGAWFESWTAAVCWSEGGWFWRADWEAGGLLVFELALFLKKIY